MHRQRFLILGCFALFCILYPRGVSAKGIPAIVTVTGPGLVTPITETNPLAMPALGMLTLMDATAPIASPAVSGQGYELTRDGFDHLLYHPDRNGAAGYVYYEGMFNGGSSYDGKWFRATTTGDATLRRLLAVHGVDVPGNSPDVTAMTQNTRESDATAPGHAIPSPLAFSAVGVMGLGLGAGVAMLIAVKVGRRRPALAMR